MGDYFDRIEGHLLDAVDRQANRRARPARIVGRVPRPRLARASTVLTAVLAIGALAVAGVFLTSVHSSTRSSPGTSPTEQPCGLAGARQLAHGAPPESLLSILGVLRRPQTPQDRPAAKLTRGVLSEPSQSAGPHSLYTQPPGVEYDNYARRAGVSAAGAAYVMPVAVATFAPRKSLRCACAPGSEAIGPIGCGRAYFAGIALLVDDGGSVSGDCCFDSAEVLAGDAGITYWTHGRWFLAFVVPDHVPSVTVYFKAGTGPRRTIKEHPVGNVVVVALPANKFHEKFNERYAWHSATGQTVQQAP
jgi:hypothetical protein